MRTKTAHIKRNFHIINTLPLCLSVLQILHCSPLIIHNDNNNSWHFIVSGGVLRVFFSDCCTWWIIVSLKNVHYPAGNGRCRKKSHQNRLLFVCFAFYQMTHTHHDWMAVFVAFSIQCSEIDGKNDIFKCFHRHFALAVVSFSLIFLTFCDASGFVFVLRAPSIIHIGKAFFSAGPHFSSTEVIDRAIDNSTIQPFT